MPIFQPLVSKLVKPGAAKVTPGPATPSVVSAPAGYSLVTAILLLLGLNLLGHAVHLGSVCVCLTGACDHAGAESPCDPAISTCGFDYYITTVPFFAVVNLTGFVQPLVTACRAKSFQRQILPTLDNPEEVLEEEARGLHLGSTFEARLARRIHAAAYTPPTRTC